MAAIWKYEVLFEDAFALSMPAGAKVLHFAAVGESSGAFWALVDPEAEHTTRHFGMRGTGHEWPEGAGYIGTAQFMGGRLVFHLFEALL